VGGSKESLGGRGRSRDYASRGLKTIKGLARPHFKLGDRNSQSGSATYSGGCSPYHLSRDDSIKKDGMKLRERAVRGRYTSWGKKGRLE